MTNDRSLLDRIAARARESEPTIPLLALPPPLRAEEIEDAQRRLGFDLHPLLAAVYRDLANGGFGPGYQLLSLVDGPTPRQAVDLYLAWRRRARPGRAWPEGVLPILPWGCDMYACVDCRSDEGTVLLFEPNDPDLVWYIDAPSLEAWFESYVDRTGWWEPEAVVDSPHERPWPSVNERAL